MNQMQTDTIRQRGSRVRQSLYEEMMQIIMRLQKDFLNFHAQFDFGELSKLHLGILGVLKKYEQLPSSVVAEKMYTSKPQMTVLLDRLESLALIRRGDDPNDRRITTVKMTPAGRSALEKGLAAAHREVTTRLEKLSDRELEEFGAALRTLQNVMAKL
jgi:DNA-binding MarR family transcriptional regulator